MNDDRGDPFAALGDGHRREILHMIAVEPRSVGALAEAMPISRPAVSRHLRLLKAAGLVEEEQVGTRRVYRLRDEGVEAVQDYLRSVWGEAAARRDANHAGWDGLLPHFVAACAPIEQRRRTNKEPAP